MSEVIKISDDLTLIIHGKQGLAIHSDHAAARHCTGISIAAAELPALLDRLNAAAEAMGIPTKQGELVTLLRETEWRMGACFWCGRSEKDGHSPYCKLEQALESVKR